MNVKKIYVVLVGTPERHESIAGTFSDLKAAEHFSIDLNQKTQIVERSLDLNRLISPLFVFF